MDRLDWDARDGVPLLRPVGAEDLGVKAAFTNREGGVSSGAFHSLNLSSFVGDEAAAVTENRRRALSAAGVAPDSLVLARQVHGADVLSVAAAGPVVAGEGDALITSTSGVTVGVLTADCVPILLVGDGRVAAVHAGWRGLVAGVIERAVTVMGGARGAWVGPAIDECCYEVGREVIEAFEVAELPVAGPGRISPPAAARAILARAEVPDVVTSGICTHCDDSFYSYRRDGQTGRQGAFVAIA